MAGVRKAERVTELNGTEEYRTATYAVSDKLAFVYKDKKGKMASFRQGMESITNFIYRQEYGSELAGTTKD